MRVLHLFHLAGVAIAVTACGGGGDGGTQPPTRVATVVITSPSVAPTITACATVNFAAEARNAQGGVVSTATINWTSSDPSKVSLANLTGTSNSAGGVGFGTSTITATTNNGTVSSTGVPVTVTTGGASASASVTATASDTFSPSCVTVTAGGTVSWTFVPAREHNVKFQGSTKPTGGDIGTTQNTTVSRTFPAAGKYDYVCDLHANMTGVVIVQ